MTRHLRVRFFGKTRKKKQNMKTDHESKVSTLEEDTSDQILNPDFLDSPLKRFFGKRFEKGIFDKWLSMQK